MLSITMFDVRAGKSLVAASVVELDDWVGFGRFGEFKRVLEHFEMIGWAALDLLV